MDSLLPPLAPPNFLICLIRTFPTTSSTSTAVAPARGPRPKFSAAQLWRLHLLVLLTPVHAFNLLLTSLPEQRRWRDFARLPNQRHLPDVRMLHEFRAAWVWAGWPDQRPLAPGLH